MHHKRERGLNIMHAIEKILAAKAGKASVHAGEIVNC